MKEFIEIAFGSITIGGIVVLLGRQLINSGFKTAISTYENKLKLITYEHQIKFSKLHEERGLILKEIYSCLYDIELSLKKLTSLFERPELEDDISQLTAAQNEIEKCRAIFERNRIFLDTNFCEKLDENLNLSLDIITKMSKATRIAQNQTSINEFDKEIENNDKPHYAIWLEQEKIVRTKINKQRIELAELFREIFGIKTKN